MDDKKLAIIFGAGAAVDVATKDNIKDITFRPPTVLNLFDSPVHMHINVDYYGVSNLWGDLKKAVEKAKANNSSLSIESFLKGLKTSEDEELRREFRHFAPYFKTYFEQISSQYCSFPNNYQTLIRKTLNKKFAKITYITLNYDLLFDNALLRTSLTSNHFGNNTKFGKYVSDTWSYYKIHGSVDWVRPFSVGEKATFEGLTGYLRAIDAVPEPFEDHLGDYDVNLNFESPTEFFYPALAVPAGESKLNLPNILETKMKSEINNCRDFLVIGFSGVDPDVWDLFKNRSEPINSLCFVTYGNDSMAKLRAKTKEMLGDSIVPTEYIDGFQAFVNAEDGLGLPGYISSL